MSGSDTDAQCPTCRETFQDCVCSVFMGVARERIRELEDAERACKAANESQRTTIRELEAELATKVENWYDKCEELVAWKGAADVQKGRAENAQARVAELSSAYDGRGDDHTSVTRAPFPGRE